MTRDTANERGAFYTRREVVDFMLDLAGYVPACKLFERRLLEPSFGCGDFLFGAVDRLLASWKEHHSRRRPRFADLSGAIRAVELHEESFLQTRKKLEARLEAAARSCEDAKALAATWLHRGDFLLQPIEVKFDFVVGNPPYVRQELVPQELMVQYRRLYRTVYDRADLYVPFIERSLRLLGPNGVLAFICPDRWTKNRYGGPLRRLVSEGYHLRFFVDMVDTDSFHSEVMAYAGIFVIAKGKGTHTRIAGRPDVSRTALLQLSSALRRPEAHEASGVRSVACIASGEEPWVLHALPGLEVIREIEAKFPLLEETGCSVRIGVATGADKVFVGDFYNLDVEPDRKLPLVMTRDIVSGDVKWRGLGVINPFGADGSLVSLRKYPRLARYLRKHSAVIRARHVASRNANGWYRTIDRIYPSFAATPKLLIPDIKGEAHVVYEDGRLYPHHNLYYVTSTKWNLRALQTVLRSSVARGFIEMYSTRMRGGYLRYQAQYLRRIRLPHWETVTPDLRAALIRAAVEKNEAAGEHAVQKLYGLSTSASRLR